MLPLRSARLSKGYKCPVRVLPRNWAKNVKIRGKRGMWKNRLDSKYAATVLEPIAVRYEIVIVILSVRIITRSTGMGHILLSNTYNA